MRLGQPAGSAVPLVWAHAEYLKLLRSAMDGKVFDRVDPVYERYCEPEGPQEGARGSWRSTACGGRSRECNAGDTLRILDEERFEVVWTDDGWKTTQPRSAAAWAAPGLRGY